MRLLRSLTIITALATLGVTGARAQQHSVVPGITLDGIPHPVSMALALWDSLDLSEAQITQLRRISDRLEQAMSERMMAELSDSGAVWKWWRITPIDSAAAVREAIAGAPADVHFELELRRATADVFKVLSAQQRIRLETLVRARMGPGASSEHPHPLCNGGGIGGGTMLSDTVQLEYSLELSADSARIGAVFVARADDRLFGFASPQPRPNIPGASESLGGGTAGRWWLLYDAKRGVAWIDTAKVELNGNNVVLLQGVDRLKRAPDVVGLVKIPATFATHGCRDEAIDDLLKAHVLKSPEVRAFVHGARK